MSIGQSLFHIKNAILSMIESKVVRLSNSNYFLLSCPYFQKDVLQIHCVYNSMVRRKIQ